jgi:glycosyltransferase involved in cell wall biosynthesis
MKLFVFRSLPLDADSRTQRNMGFFDKELAYSCTWEKEASLVKHDNAFNFPFSKSGHAIVRSIKYLLFLFWVPYTVFTQAKKGDVIIFMDLETVFFGGLAAKIKGATAIFDIVDPFAQTKRSLKNIAKLIDWLECRLARNADILMVPHDCRMQYYNDMLGKGAISKEAFIVENVPNYTFVSANSKEDRKQGECLIGYFGTLDYGSRGLEFLISLAKEFPNTISVLFAGQGAMETELVHISTEYDNISFVGGFNADTLPELYNKVDFTWAYYCPSIPLHRYAAPNKYYEHLYFNTPIITSEIIPQFKVIEELNSGISIDVSVDAPMDVIHRLLNFLENRSILESELLSSHWQENYSEYYINKKLDFKRMLTAIHRNTDAKKNANNSIAIIGTVGVPACYGGFETLVENLLDENDKNKLITVYCSSKSYSEKPQKHKNAHLHYIPLNANGVQSIPYDIWSLCHAVMKKTDNILLLGVSGAICLPILKLLTKARVITNIDGLEWRRDKWGTFAKKFLKFSEKLAVKYSDVVVADNKGIADYVLEEYGMEAEVIAYGGDHAVITDLNLSDAGYALALCRIEPENNVEMILESFSKTNKKLMFIGNWNNSDFGRKMKANYQSFENIDIVSPVYEIEKLFELRQKCSFYVHGHSAGGTNPSLVEMMHFNKNILAFDCNYNRASTEDHADFFSNVEGLVHQIEQEGSFNNADTMKEIAQRRYTWKIVKQQYFSLFK